MKSGTADVRTVQTASRTAPQAQPGPFWRDRGLWLQLVIQTAAFLLFGTADTGNAFSFAEDVPAWMLLCGYLLVYVGLLVQRWHAERGLVVVAVGLAATGVSLAGIYVLAYFVVCYEAWFISAFVRRRRRLWLALLTVGSLVSVLAVVLLPFAGVRWGGLVNDSAFDADTGASGADVVQLVMVCGVFSLLTLISVALFWQLGLTTRRQNERMEALAARAELAAVTERTRIAREMHDIVAHSLTAVIAQADGGRYAGRTSPETAIEALDTISRTGRDALAQMRQLLSVLREDVPDGTDGSPGAAEPSRATDAPPGVAGVPGLVEDARRSGLDVDFRVLGEPVAVEAGVGLTVYRTVQECLTNILKHAGQTRARVLLDWNAPGRLRVTVDNAPGRGLIDGGGDAGGDGDGDGQGQGLVGLRERARIHHGTAEWGVSDTYVGGWRVDVVLPVTA